MNMRLGEVIKAIKASNYSLSTVQSLHEAGFNFGQLNACSQAGEVICGLVERNFGLGLRLLTNCGICLAVKEPSNGNTPLILVAAEGLCGPVKYLIDNVPTEHLLHVNSSRKSVLQLLLTRAHGSCGCLEALVRRLPLQENGHPTDVGGSVVILNVEFLLENIKSSCLKRVMSVIGLWISINYIDLNATNNHTDEISSGIEEQVLSPILVSCREEPDIALEMLQKYLDMLAKLIILDQIDSQCIQNFIRVINFDQELGDENNSLQFLSRGLARLSTMFFPVQPLHFMVVRAIRRNLQKSMRLGYQHEAPVEAGKFIFHQQVNQLVLPGCLKKTLLLQGDMFIQY